MSWAAEEWELFAHLLEEWWKDELPDGARLAWQIALDDMEPKEAAATLKALLRRGQTWRPSVAEFVAAFEERRADGIRSWDEAWPVVYAAMSRFDPGSEGSAASVVETVRSRAGDCVAGWLAAYGVRSLAAEPVDDPEWGGAVRKRLRDSYTEMLATPESRDRLVLALDAPPRRRELRRLDPVQLPEAVA